MVKAVSSCKRLWQLLQINLNYKSSLMRPCPLSPRRTLRHCGYIPAFKWLLSASCPFPENGETVRELQGWLLRENEKGIYKQPLRGKPGTIISELLASSSNKNLKTQKYIESQFLGNKGPRTGMLCFCWSFGRGELRGETWLFLLPFVFSQSACRLVHKVYTVQSWRRTHTSLGPEPPTRSSDTRPALLALWKRDSVRHFSCSSYWYPAKGWRGAISCKGLLANSTLHLDVYLQLVKNKWGSLQ